MFFLLRINNNNSVLAFGSGFLGFGDDGFICYDCFWQIHARLFKKMKRKS